jgi:H+/Cl- antiporter ClcA
MAAAIGGGIASLVAALLSRRRPKRKKKEQSQMEFSKRIFIGLSVLAGAVAVFTCFMVWRTEDVSVTQALIDNAFGLLKVGVVSYFSKAALENRVKLAHFYPKLREHIMGDRGGEP